MKLNFNYQFAKKFFREEEITNMKPFAELANEILEKGGTIISEIPPSLKVKGIYLLQRNRLQVYLTEELLILETGKKGGTITTLKVAFSEKKRIYIRNIKINQTIFNMKNISLKRKDMYTTIYMSFLWKHLSHNISLRCHSPI